MRTHTYAWCDLSFQDFVRIPCPECGRNIVTVQRAAPPYDLLLEGGNTCTDLIAFTGAGGPLFLLSEKALLAFHADGIQGIGSVAPVNAKWSDGDKRKNRSKIPPYYQVEVSGRIDFDLKAMFLKKKRLCPACGQFDWNRERLYPVFLDANSHDGGDLCRVTSLPGRIICTHKVALSVKKHKLTGFQLTVQKTTNQEVV